jgi:hypothetical protein
MSGQLVGGIIGGIVGSVIPVVGWELGAAIGGALGGVIAPNTPGLPDVRVLSSSYGVDIPQVWGNVRVPVNIIWSTDIAMVYGGVSAYEASIACLICKGNSLITSDSLIKLHANSTIPWEVNNPNNIVSLAFYPGSETQPIDPTISGNLPNTPAYRGICYLVINGFNLKAYNSSIPNLSVEINTGPVTLDQILADIMGQCGMTSADWDLSQATTTNVAGYILPQRVSGKDAIKELLTAYHFDLVDVDGVIRAVQRGGAPVATITRANQGYALVNSGNIEAKELVERKRIQDLDLMKKLDLKYYSMDAQFQTGLQTYTKQSALTQSTQSIDFNISMHDSDAAELVKRLLWEAWLERVSYITTISPQFKWLCAADVLTLVTDSAGTTQRVRIVGIEYGAPGSEIKLELVRDNSVVTVGTISGGTISQPHPPVITTGGGNPSNPVPMSFFAWSGKEIDSNDYGLPGFYVVATQPCVIYVSTDGTNYTTAGIITTGGIFGTISSTPNSTFTPDANGFDTTNNFTVDVGTAILNSSTESMVLAGTGGKAVILPTAESVSPGSDYEILYWTTATLVSSGVYTISDLLRSQLGTTYGSAVIGDTFVNVDSTLQRIVTNNSTVGNNLYVKCVQAGSTLALTTAQEILIATPTPSLAQSLQQGSVLLSASTSTFPNGIILTEGPNIQTLTPTSGTLEIESVWPQVASLPVASTVVTGTVVEWVNIFGGVTTSQGLYTATGTAGAAATGWRQVTPTLLNTNSNIYLNVIQVNTNSYNVSANSIIVNLASGTVNFYMPSGFGNTMFVLIKCPNGTPYVYPQGSETIDGVNPASYGSAVLLVPMGTGWVSCHLP